MALGDNIRRDSLIPENGNGSIENEKSNCHAIFNGFHNPILITDEQGEISFANKATALLWSYSTEELVGQPISKVLNYKSQRAFDKNGQTIPILISESVAQTDKGAIYTYFIRRAEQEQTSAKVMTEEARDAAITLEGTRIIECNKQALVSFGLDTKSKVIGSDIRDFSWKGLNGQIDQFKNHLEQAVTNHHHCFEWTFKKENGGKWFGEVDLYVHEMKGEMPIMQLLVRDITDRKLYEQRLLEVQRIAQIGSWSLNLADKKITWNEQLYHILAYPVNTVPSFERWTDRIHPEDLKRVSDTIQHAIDHKTISFKVTYRIQIPESGILKYVESNGEVELSDENEPIRIICTVQQVRITKGNLVV